MGVAGPTGPYASEFGNRMEHLPSRSSTPVRRFPSRSSRSSVQVQTQETGLASATTRATTTTAPIMSASSTTDPNPPTYITSGPNTQQVDALFSGDRETLYPAYCATTCAQPRPTSRQAQCTHAGAPFTFTGTYSIGDASGSGTFDVIAPTPEPSSLVFLGTGLLGLASVARKKFLQV